jgi:glutathione S-transferase
MGSPKGFARADVDKALGELEETCRRMHEAIERNGGPWIMGKRFTLADVLVMPSIDRMADLGLSHIWESKYPNVTRWYDALQARPAFAKTYYPGARVSEFLEMQPLYIEDR